MKQGRKMFRLIKKSLKDFKITQENNQGNAYKVLSVFRFHQNRILNGLLFYFQRSKFNKTEKYSRLKYNTFILMKTM